MEFDVNNIELPGSPFARLKQGSAVEELNDFTLYVKNNDEEWIEEISNLEQYDVCVLDERILQNPELKNILGEDNLIIPIKTNCDDNKFYIVGSIEESWMLEFAAKLMYGDVTDLAGSYSLECSALYRIPCAAVSSQQMLLATFLDESEKQAFIENRKKEFRYKQMQELKLNLVWIAKDMRSKNKEKRSAARIRFAEAMTFLNDREITQVIMALLMNNGSQKDLDQELNRILNRDEMGEKTQCRIIVDGKEKFEKKVFIIGPDNKAYDTNFSPIAKTIYVLNLLKVKNDEEISEPFALVDNYRKFDKVYWNLQKSEYQKNYEETVLRRVKDYYNEIEEKLAGIFKNFNEDYSPFKVDARMPIVVKKEYIHISKSVGLEDFYE